MQMTFSTKAAVLATLALGAVGAIVPTAQAATLFSQREVNPSSFMPWLLPTPVARLTSS